MAVIYQPPELAGWYVCVWGLLLHLLNPYPVPGEHPRRFPKTLDWMLHT